MNIALMRKCALGVLIACMLALSGCASVPMASKELDAQMKTFPELTDDKAGLYIFRNSFVGQALLKQVYIDNALIGATANKVFFYREITPGPHTLSTQSEFSNNNLDFTAEGGKYYFVRQYIKLGVFVGGANLELVSEEEGKKEVAQCMMAQ